MIHELKTSPEPFQAVIEGRKRFELRVADRSFAVDDFVLLREWEPETGAYTGRWLRARITYIAAPGTWGLPAELCVLSIRPGSCGVDDRMLEFARGSRLRGERS